MSLLERVYFFHNELTRNRYPNARTLMREFEISQPTARRDIAYLRDRLLAPLAYDQRKNGFYYEDQSFSLPFVNNSRIVFLLGMLSRLAEETGLKNLPEIRQLEQRLSAMIGQDYKRLEEIIHCTWIEVEHPDPDVFKEAIDAIVSRRQLEITYESPQKAITSRSIAPVKLINYQGRWYLRAWCNRRKEPRTFLLARIKTASISRNELKEHLPIDEHFDTTFGIFIGPVKYHAKILFTGSAAQIVKNQVWHKHQIIQEIDKGIMLELPVADDREVIMKILQYGRQAEVLTPLHLRETIAEESKCIYRLYEEGVCFAKHFP
ncbi:MAG: WYL domain-containing protein [Desulfofustis sp.]|nr:WYL domain-containing protein [Desulfofustis sp.]